MFSYPVMQFGDAFDVGRNAGMTRSIMSLGALVGPPNLNSKTSGFEAVGNCAGLLRKLSSISASSSGHDETFIEQRHTSGRSAYTS